LRHSATSRKGSIPSGVTGFFIDLILPFPGVVSSSNRNWYQEYLLGVKAADEYE